MWLDKFFQPVLEQLEKEVESGRLTIAGKMIWYGEEGTTHIDLFTSHTPVKKQWRKELMAYAASLVFLSNPAITPQEETIIGDCVEIRLTLARERVNVPLQKFIVAKNPYTDENAPFWATFEIQKDMPLVLSVLIYRTQDEAERFLNEARKLGDNRSL